jgi:hypothetical protein
MYGEALYHFFFVDSVDKTAKERKVESVPPTKSWMEWVGFEQYIFSLPIAVPLDI